MQKFERILFASTCQADELPALRQALSIARNNSARLEALLVRPELPQEFAHHAQGYDDYLATRFRAQCEQAARELAWVSEPVPITVQSGAESAKVIIRYASSARVDLLIKTAESTNEDQGFDVVDMELLRYFPTALWLSRPIAAHRDQIRVAVAIDPETTDAVAKKLSLRLLRLARALADDGDGKLRIIACWEYELEGFLRRNSWVSLPAEDISSSVLRAADLSRSKLNRLVADAEITGAQEIYHLRGRPGELIPHFTAEQRIDILVMGTVARSGIPGVLFGNTAEKIVQKLNCSLLAVKPDSFVTPIKI